MKLGQDRARLIADVEECKRRGIDRLQLEAERKSDRVVLKRTAIPVPPLGTFSEFGVEYPADPGNRYIETRDEIEAAEARERARANAHRGSTLRRARERGARIVEPIDRTKIIRRDRSICHICKTKVEANDIHLDHVIPLARGGDHSEANLAVSHSLCNLSKGARLVA